MIRSGKPLAKVEVKVGHGKEVVIVEEKEKTKQNTFHLIVVVAFVARTWECGLLLEMLAGEGKADVRLS